jgi:hypothetical protein
VEWKEYRKEGIGKDLRNVKERKENFKKGKGRKAWDRKDVPLISTAGLALCC